MNKLSYLFIAVLLFAAGSRAQEDVDDEDEYADIDRALLVVRKSVKEEVVVQGRQITVSIDIFNAGSNTAKNVELEDYMLEGASIGSGSLAASFSKIAVGSQVKHSYTMVFSTGAKGVQMPLATVRYLADDSEDVQTGYSSTQDFYIRTPVQHIIQHALHGGKYLSLGFARTEADWRNLMIFVAMVGTALGANYAVKASSAASASRKRSKALADLKSQ